MFNTHQLNIVRNEKLNFIEIITEDIFYSNICQQENLTE